MMKEKGIQRFEEQGQVLKSPLWRLWEWDGQRNVVGLLGNAAITGESEDLNFIEI